MNNGLLLTFVLMLIKDISLNLSYIFFVQAKAAVNTLQL